MVSSVVGEWKWTSQWPDKPYQFKGTFTFNPDGTFISGPPVEDTGWWIQVEGMLFFLFDYGPPPGR